MAGDTRGGASTRTVSVVIPVFNEGPSLWELYGELTGVLGGMSGDYEIVFVDDGSTDGSRGVLVDLARHDVHVRPISLRANAGQSAALAAGFRRARGDVIVSMDGDLQDDPREIPSFLAALEAGCDLVVGWRKRRNDSTSKILMSRIYNWLSRVVTRVDLHDSNCTFKAYRRFVVTDLALYGERHRYIHVLVAARGYRIGEVPVRHRPRRQGRSKYGAGRLLRGVLDLLGVVFLTRFGRRPLHFLGGAGAAMIVAGTGIDLYLTVLWFSGYPIGTRPLLLLGVLLILVGVQSVFVGLLAEFMLHLSGRPVGPGAEIFDALGPYATEAEPPVPPGPSSPPAP
jgi:glycosyltransferase involved in cell wall biosynthesis